MINVIFFGAASDAAGMHRAEIDIGNPRPADDVLRQIVKAFPNLGKHRLLMAVNQEHTRGSEVVRDGDEVAVFTPVSGG